MRTLPVNIAENKSYPHVEFVVLDYNSMDNIGEWIRETQGEFIQSGLLKYYKTSEPQYFHSSHAKNMALRLGTGNIVCMVDADNYAGPGYVHWINSVFSSYGNNTIITTLRKDSIPFRDQGGKFCIGREEFLAARGLDEDLVGYGMEDTDLINRMENAGGRRIYIEAPSYLRFIEHSDVDRLRHFEFTNSISKLYLHTLQSETGVTHLLYLFKDNRFSAVKYKFHDSLKSNLVKSFHGWVLDGSSLRQGDFQHFNGQITVTFQDGEAFAYKEETGALYSPDEAGQAIWKEITDNDDMFNVYIMGYTECINRLRYADNDNNRHRINPNGWGMGRVFRNFDINDPVDLA